MNPDVQRTFYVSHGGEGVEARVILYRLRNNTWWNVQAGYSTSAGYYTTALESGETYRYVIQKTGYNSVSGVYYLTPGDTNYIPLVFIRESATTADVVYPSCTSEIQNTTTYCNYTWVSGRTSTTYSITWEFDNGTTNTTVNQSGGITSTLTTVNVGIDKDGDFYEEITTSKPLSIFLMILIILVSMVCGGFIENKMTGYGMPITIGLITLMGIYFYPKIAIFGGLYFIWYFLSRWTGIMN